MDKQSFLKQAAESLNIGEDQASSAAGVDTVKELRNRNAANLAETMDKVNGEKNLARTSPPTATVEKWVAAAKTMDLKITY